MKNICASLITILCWSVAFDSLALADKLPKKATALSASEVTALYSNQTAVWGPSMNYFAVDGTVKQLTNGNSKPGTWTVKENEICMDINGVDPTTKKLNGKTFTDCWQWHKDSKNQYFTLYSKHWDNSKVDPTKFGKNENKFFKPGDLIGAKFVPPQN